MTRVSCIRPTDRSRLWLQIFSLLLLSAYQVVFGDQPNPEFKPLFNGTDLAGWVQVNCAPETFTVKDGIIVSSGVPTGILRTDRQYENFVLELEWKHQFANIFIKELD